MAEDSFVFYRDWVAEIEGVYSELGAERAYEFLHNIISYGLDGTITTNSELLKKMIEGPIKGDIDRAKARYHKAIDDGKKGGRPKKELDIEQIKNEMKNGKSVLALAKELGVSEGTLRNRLKESESVKVKSSQKTVLKPVLNADGFTF